MMTAELKRFLLLASDKRDSTRRLRKFFAPRDKVLDIGSLDAPYTRQLRNEVIAIDIPPNGIFGYSDEGLKSLQTVRPGFKAMYANAEKMPFEDRTFDKIVATEVMEHIENDQAAAKEMSRVLKSDGALYITTPNGDVLPLDRGIPEHLRHYTKQQLHELFAPHFSEIRQETRFKFYGLLSLQYELLNSWAQNRSKVWLLAGYLAVLGLCEILVRIERLLPGEGYNQVLICSKPRLSR
jgi:ubiquinone/menaquinone biosynthesis C-methylase UbiE